MNILIIGAGNCGITYAADLTIKGHKITLLKTSNKLHNDAFDKIIQRSNQLIFNDNNIRKQVKIFKVTNCFFEAFSIKHDLIIITTQTNYHEEIILKIKQFLKKNDIILFEPGYYSTAYLQKHGIKDFISVEAESSPIDCRLDQEANVNVLFKNIRNPVGIYPHDKKQDAIKILQKLGYNFVYLDSVIEAALHNPNLIVHTVGAIMSIPRIEYTQGEYWMYKEVFTKSVWNLVEKLDAEKNEILNKLDLNELDYIDACKHRNFEDLSIDSKEAFFNYAMHFSPKGPFVSDSRYITEDVSQGLVLMESLGNVLNIETPVCSSLITLASFSLKRDFRKTGRTLEQLGLNKNNILI